MRKRILLLDPFGTVEDVTGELEEFDIEVEHAESVLASSEIVALLVSPDFSIGEEELRRVPRLRIVATTSTGFDHLDLEAIARAGCWATNVAGYCDDEVADHTIAFILDLLRGITLLDRGIRAGEWDFGRQLPVRIAGTRLGIVGLGRIGRRVAARAAALDMRVRGYDPAISVEQLRAMGTEPIVSLEELLGQSDVLTLHVPLTAETRHMINAHALASLPRGAFLVNCSRADLVDHQALGEALRRGHLGGAALDVLPVEPPSASEPALTWPRTIINPHAAFASPATIREPYRRAAAAVAEVLRGNEPRDVIARPMRRQPP
jgi:D-3-phosphoglycerate dehydrogenase